MDQGDKANTNQTNSEHIAFITESFEKYRDKLLDTSKKNNLISFRHSERSRQHIRIIDELPDFIYSKLSDGKKLTFKPLPEEDQNPADEETREFRLRFEQAKLTDEDYISAMDDMDEDEEDAQNKKNQIDNALRNKIRKQLNLPVWNEKERLTNIEIAKKHGLNPDYEMPQPVNGDKQKRLSRTNNYIQTRLKPTEMENKLSGLTTIVHSDIEEFGVNTFYIVFGFLKLYEAESSDKPCIAPLLLLQLEIVKERSKKGYIFYIRSTGEEPEVNLCLSEYLQKNFGIQLPEFDTEDSPEDYMTKAARHIQQVTIPKKNSWRIQRFITIGRFRFERLVMYHDLNSAQALVAKSKLLKKLLGGSEESTGNDYAGDYDIDTPEVEKAVPLLITPADASQHSALVDVAKGKNLTIKGPPGTGKSQTITNIIANALIKGKRVLFLAEKMAALNVVYERLSKAGLGPYCLELHSTKAKKTEVLKSFKKRLELLPSEENVTSLKEKFNEFKQHRDYLAKYVDTLNEKFGCQNKTIHDHLWAFLRLRDELGDLSGALNQVKISFAEADISTSKLTAYIDELKKIAGLKAEIDRDADQGRHPWFFISNIELLPPEQKDLQHLLSQWKELLEKIQIDLKSFTDQFKLPPILSACDFKSFFDSTASVSQYDIDTIDQKIIAQLNNKEKAVAFLAFTDAVHRYKAAKEKINAIKDPSITTKQTDNIAKQAEIVKRLDADKLSAVAINAKITALQEELNLWEKSLKPLLVISERFATSKNQNLDNIYTLLKLQDDITAIPADCLLLRTKAVIDATNTERLKAAAKLQQHIRELKIDFDLSAVGDPAEIRACAMILKNSGFFSFLTASYRHAKKYFMQICKHTTRFDYRVAAQKLFEIADVKEEQQIIEHDTILQTLRNSCSNDASIDIEKMYKVNAWAGNIRRCYPVGDEFTRSIQEWFLTAGSDELIHVQGLSESTPFTALKNRLTDIKENISFDIPVEQYLNTLADNIKKLTMAHDTLQHIATSQQVTFADITADLFLIKEAREAKRVAEENTSIQELYGDAYAGVDTNTQLTDSTACFIKDYLDTTELNNSFNLIFNQDFSVRWQDFIKGRKTIKTRCNAIKEQAIKVQRLSSIDVSVLHNTNDPDKITYSDLINLFTNALDKPDSLNCLIKLKTCRNKAAQDITGMVLSLYDKHGFDYKTLPSALQYMICNTIVGAIYKRYSQIINDTGTDLSQVRNKIKSLDKELIELSQKELCRMLSLEQPVDGISSGRKSEWTEKSLLDNEMIKQRKHIPIRNLMKRAEKSIKKIKPCFLMSPLSVAQYLTHEKFTFDLLIIDEASQMRPEDALGAVIRSEQIVVVGDPEQLPPTAFFQSDTEDDDEEEDFTTTDIMDMAASSFRPARILNRHYRSRHESLINFSNYHFYENRLMLFPSPVENPDNLGVRLEYVGGTYTAKSNMDEVQAIVKGALEFMQKYPERSLGIATMNTTQRDLIEIEMDRAFIDNEHAANYRAKWQNTLESFFVKNLENVQGDERDAIFISTVYGPDKNGIVMQRFGPINSKTGHRRLNVLFTRAKKNMLVFTSLKPEDIKISPSSSQGVKALKGFLTYAKTGMIDSGKESCLEPDSDFEVWVKEKLEHIGCEVIPQVGVAGYRIDLGVKHPKYRDGFLMGIECDGATYHSAKSARERDAIRQQHLESLGWHIYRIWSTDWFASPEAEFEKLKNYIETRLNNRSSVTVM
ncbi:MAG: DUF4011 domain-containing protein [Endozoicomonadaceae bacterium]|nr:DUF4011 domain-containing protein [Endozoicomonadaceae bacterium]